MNVHFTTLSFCSRILGINEAEETSLSFKWKTLSQRLFKKIRKLPKANMDIA